MFGGRMKNLTNLTYEERTNRLQKIFSASEYVSNIEKKRADRESTVLLIVLTVLVSTKIGRPGKGGGEKMKITKKMVKEFQKWLEENSKTEVLINAAQNILENDEGGIEQNGHYELKAFETKSKHTEIYTF
jgi:Sec-independent protein translocase protein TatA